jgi:hypothetical protein
VIVSTVEDRFCIANTEYQLINFAALAGLSNLFGTTREQIKLPVEESQILTGLTKIKVGFKAILEKQQAKLPEKRVEALPPKANDEIKTSGSQETTKRSRSKQ